VLAKDCETARAHLAEFPIDVFVADFAVREINVLKLIRGLRRSDQYMNLPVLMLSTNAGRHEIIEASQAGVNGFLAKPFVPDSLQKKIIELYRLQRRIEQDRNAAKVWQGRATYATRMARPFVIFGEAIQSEEELLSPGNREVKSYLNQAWLAIARCNERQPDLNAEYVIESQTKDINLYLKKEEGLQWVKAIFLSCQCHGNASVIARLLRISRGKTLPIYLIYDQKGDIPDFQMTGLKKLGIKIVRRARLTEKIDDLMQLHLGEEVKEKVEVERQKVLAPAQVRVRVMADIELMTKLPPLPQVYEKISALARDQKSDMKKWIEVIEVEPMTCATILRHANSSPMGFKAEITGIDRAIVLLGKNTVSGLVAGEAVRQSFTAVQDMGFKLEEFWLHNVAVGYAAHLLSLAVDGGKKGRGAQADTLANSGLAEEAMDILRGIDLPSRLKLPPGSPCFAAGAMHDIGKVVMAHSYPGLFPVLLQEMEAKEWSIPMLAAEQAVAGGLTHPIAGEILLRNWGLAGQLGSVVLSHHTPDPDDGLTFLVGIADVVGQVALPFPRVASSPVAAAVEAGDLARVKQFLPEGFLDQPLLNAKELASLVTAIRPRVVQFVEETRRSVS
jgi:two-component system chemotaxis response regulator CheY